MRRAASLLTVALLAHTSMGAQPARFTAEDMLKVVTASVQDLSDDGRLVAITERRTYDNAETDNYRYGDPTFVAPSALRLVVIDTRTGERRLPLGDVLANVRQSVFSRDGKRLAILVAAPATPPASPVISLLVWNTSGGPATPVAIKSPDVIVPTSTLEWTPDGSRVTLSMRTVAREKAAADRFAALTRGPVIVHSAKEPFLEWDDLNRLNRWRNVVEVDVATGMLTTRVPERKITNYRASRDGSSFVLQEDATEKMRWTSSRVCAGPGTPLTRTSISLMCTVSPRSASRRMFDAMLAFGGRLLAETCICRPTPSMGTPAAISSRRRS
jgi:dipeptidyl aminopeptidase/acylaminoacyl peptidase